MTSARVTGAGVTGAGVAGAGVAGAGVTDPLAITVREPPAQLKSATRHGGRTRLVALAAAPALAAALSAYQLAGRSLGFDEGATVAIASQHGSALWSAIAHDGGNMSGYYLLLHLLIGAFGDGLAVLRLPSVVAMVATVALVQAIGLRLFGLRAALIAGVLAALSLPLVYWAQTARAYALMVAFVCAAYLALVAIAHGRGSRRHWLLYVIAMAVAMYCSFVAVLVVPAQLVVLARRRAARRKLATALVTVAVLCVPLAVLAAGRGSGQLFWVPRPTRMVETQVLQSLTSAGLAPSFHHIAITYLTMWATVAAVVAVVGLTTWRARRGEPVWPAVLVLAWCTLPAALTFLWSFVGQPIFVPRNLIASTPALALVLAPPLAEALRRRPAASGRGVAALVAAIILPLLLAARALPVAHSYGVSPEPWDQVTATVLAGSRPGDCIAFYPQDGRMAFSYYLARSEQASAVPRSVLPVAPWSLERPYVESYATPSPSRIASATTGCRRLWLVTSHEGQANGPPAAQAHRAAWIALDVALERRFGIAPLRTYGYAAAIHVQLLH